MKAFIRYLKEKKKVLITGAVFGLVIIVTDFLYRVPWQACCYSLVVCTVVGLVIILIDSYKKNSHLDTIKRMENSLKQSEIMYPAPMDELEKSYQEQILKLKSIMLDESLEASLKYQQMMDYYTLWVHQIKTPISSMRLVLGQMDSTQSRKISSDLTRIEQYVSMVLMYLKLDFGNSDYVIKPENIDEIIKPILRKLAPDFIGRKLSITYEPIERTVITDGKWLSFCIEQILTNSLKYTNSGGIKIFIEDDFLVIEDTGIGILAQDLPRIFEKGYTGFNGHETNQSSGIGLYLCKRICDDLCLTLKASSTINVGTKIKISLKQDKLNVRD